MGMKFILFMWLSLFVLACNDLDDDQAQEILPIPQFTSYFTGNSTALQVYELKGTLNGTNYFNINNWKSGSGGTWNYWFIINGQFHEKPI